MRTINYDFNDLIISVGDLMDNFHNKSKIEGLKREINKFFKDGKCQYIKVTQNDKMFFGMSVTPHIDEQVAIRLLQDDEPFRFKQYYIEIDSKLFNPFLELSPAEITAILLHEIGHVVNDSSLVDTLRSTIQSMVLKDKLSTIGISTYPEILAFGVKDAARKLSSMFYIYKQGEVLADEFVFMCGFGDQLSSAFSKICKSSYGIHKESEGKLSALGWSMSLYKETKLKRIPAVRLIRKMKSLTGSETEKQELENLEKALGLVRVNESTGEIYITKEDFDRIYIDECSYSVNSGFITEKTNGNYITNGNVRKSKYGTLAYQFTNNGLNKFKHDLYDYKMRIRHVNNQDDAIYLMRQIGIRISVMEDYLNNNKLGQYECDAVWDLLDKYYALREELSNNTKYNFDYTKSLIQVNYPEIKEY